ncbi:MAG: hypothetical protein ABFS46_01545 [Myxococcota bacterium]
MRPFVPLLLLAVVVGCQPAAPGTPDELAARYHSGHDSGNLEALTRLVCWDRVDERTRRSVEKQLGQELGRPITETRVEVLSPGFELEYALDGITYRPNLVPVRRLRITFTPAEPGEPPRTEAMSFLLGVKDGGYWIAPVAPVSTTSG